jgi:glucokinase
VSKWRLVSDVGGTNVRFARAYGAGLERCICYPVSEHPAFSAALDRYLAETGGAEGCAWAAIGAAGAVCSGVVRLTNAAWEISEAAVSAKLGVPCVILNDVQAVAFSLPVLDEAAFEVLGSRKPNLQAARRLLTANIGTGFGAATLVKSSNGWVCCPSEAGHMSLNFPVWPDNSLRQRFTSAEHVLSGRGLCNLRAAILNEPYSHDTADFISWVQSGLRCAETLRLFTQIAGEVLGNLALAVAAWDGVYLCGSVAKAFASVADLPLLRQVFEDKGPMTERMRTIPIALITRDDAALAGLAALGQDALA